MLIKIHLISKPHDAYQISHMLIISLTKPPDSGVFKKHTPVCLFIIISLKAFDVTLVFFLPFFFLKLLGLSSWLNCPVRDE